MPDDIIFIEAVPKTSVGKFDKKALRDQFKDFQLASA
jgi:fatty-acyl-CoA synthase